MRKTQLIRGGVVALIMALLPLPGFAQTLERIQAAGTINIATTNLAPGESRGP